MFGFGRLRSLRSMLILLLLADFLLVRVPRRKPKLEISSKMQRNIWVNCIHDGRPFTPRSEDHVLMKKPKDSLLKRHLGSSALA